MAAEAATEDAMNADETEVDACVTRTAEAPSALTLVQAPAAASRIDSIMAA